MKSCGFLHVKLTDKFVHSKKLYITYNVHKMLWELWDDKGEAPFLFRMEENDIYVLFNCPIQNENILWLKGARITYFEVPEFSGRFLYEVVVNPTLCQHSSHKRIPLKKDEDIFNWWGRQGKRCGFEIEKKSTLIYNKRNDIFKKNKKDEIVIFKSTISGILNITDEEVFNENFMKGFGRSKRFGCGLMLMKKKIGQIKKGHFDEKKVRKNYRSTCASPVTCSR